jgi:preprotein translocase subunit SecA
MFEEMVAAIQKETVRRLISVRLKKDEEVKRERVSKTMVENVGGDDSAPKQQPRKVVKIGRNDPCPCGSGLKWKNCTCAQYHPDN